MLAVITVLDRSIETVEDCRGDDDTVEGCVTVAVMVDVTLMEAVSLIESVSIDWLWTLDALVVKDEDATFV